MFIRVTKSLTAKFKKVYLVEGYRDEKAGSQSNESLNVMEIWKS